MGRAKRMDIHPDQDEAVKKRKSYRFELSGKQAIGYSLCLFAALCWMFVFGILVGRGLPVDESKELSWRGRLTHFLGLTKEKSAVTGKAAQSWEDPKKMVESLSYYEDLTQKQKSSTPAAAKERKSLRTAGAKTPTDDSDGQKTKSSQVSSHSLDKPVAPVPSQNPAPKSLDESAPKGQASEHFTLLISSLREMENAQKLLDQLRAKGYSPRIESLNLSGMGHWNRVLVGSFRSREEATRFAAEFNRKEGMEALVIREGG